MLINKDGFGNRHNNGIVYMEVHDGRLFAGTWNPTDGCLIYASSDGRTWTAVVDPGFGNKANQSVVKLRSVGQYLYAGIWNPGTGAQLWRAVDPHEQADWEPITEDGFGNAANQAIGSIRPFKDHLYVGMFNPTQGEEMWVSPDGAAGSFVKQFDGGLGVAGATDASYLYVWEDHLYLGTESAQPPHPGCDVWRTDGTAVAGDGAWERVASAGFPTGHSFNAFRMIAFRDQLYVGTWEFGASSFTTALGRYGTQIWRTAGGNATPFADWEQVNEDGFGNVAHDSTLAMEVWNDSLYVGGFGNHGFLVRTDDGMNWSPVTAPGFLETAEFGVHAMVVFNGELYVGIQNWFQSCELWVVAEESAAEGSE